MYEPNETAAIYAFDYMSRAVTQTKLTGDAQLLSTLNQGPQTVDQVASQSEFTPITVRKRLNEMVDQGVLCKGRMTSIKDDMYQVTTYFLPEHAHKIKASPAEPKTDHAVRIQPLQQKILDALNYPMSTTEVASLIGVDSESVRRSMGSMSRANEQRGPLVVASGMLGKCKVWEKIK